MNKHYQQQVRQRGAAMLLFMLFFLFGASALALAFSRTVYADLQAALNLERALAGQQAADAGVEEFIYRFKAGLTPDATEQFSLAGATVDAGYTFDGVNDRFVLTASGTSRSVVRQATANLYTGAGASFSFGVQTGNGGFEMENNTAIYGNVFSNGPIEGQGSATIYGDVISAGPSGLVEGDLTATGSARARIIRETSNNSLFIEGDAYAYELDGGEVDGDAYCDHIINGTVTGSGGCLSYVPEEDTIDLPIPDEDIEDIQQDILDNGTVIAAGTGPCTTGEFSTTSDISLGFVKIECDFRVKKQGAATILTLTGPVWVEGNIIFEGGPTISASTTVGNRTVPVIADNQYATATSGKITVENGTTFNGSGEPKSYILLISQNNDAETGGVYDEHAIFLGQSSQGDLLSYAGHGRIRLSNSVSLKEITAYQVSLGNGANVRYESGLVNVLFTSGPGGGYTIEGWEDQ